MGFTKLDERITRSSIMAEPSDTFKVWITLLADCREDGIAYVSETYLSAICRLPAEAVMVAIKALESPDPLSRSTTNEGRRVCRVDGGFKILNYHFYRDYSYSKAKEAERKRKWREHRRTGHVPNVPDSSASASASASASLKEGVQGGIEKEFASFWDAYPKKVAKQDALKAYKALRKTTPLADIASATNGYTAYARREITNIKYVMHPATFLRNEKWKDYIGADKPPL